MDERGRPAAQAVNEARDTDLDVDNGFAKVRLSITVGTAASLIQAVPLCTNPIFVLASAFDQAGVTQII